jgi:superfamily II DNA/RNA helicase
MPPRRQSILTSATLSNQVKFIKRIVHAHTTNPTGKMVTLRLKDGILPNAAQLRQYHVQLSDHG